LRAAGIAGLALAIGLAVANAQEMKAPRISHAEVDWDAVSAELRTIEPLKTLASSTDNATAEPLATLNRLTGGRFVNVASSPVPVLLPFDTDAYLRDRVADVTPDATPSPYLFGYDSTPFFQAGPGGYDAVVVARAQDMKDLGINFPDRIFIQISGASVVYELAEPNGMIGWPVNGGLETDFPGIKRMFLENYLRYTFVRYGVPYVVSIECFDGPSRFRKIACKDAEKVGIHLLRSLRIVGGQPQPAPANPARACSPSPRGLMWVS